MTEPEFLDVLSTVRPIDVTAILDRPLAETPLDSFDLLELRSALEARLGTRIEDAVWLEAKTLRALRESLP